MYNMYMYKTETLSGGFRIWYILPLRVIINLQTPQYNTVGTLTACVYTSAMSNSIGWGSSGFKAADWLSVACGHIHLTYE